MEISKHFKVEDLGEVQGRKLTLNIERGTSDVTDWIENNASSIKALLDENGAVRIPSLNIQGSKKLEKVLTTILDRELIDYTYRSTPRTKMRGRIYTSSEYHPDETIFLHNENAYSNRWPMYIAFYCVQPSPQGGATPIASNRAIYNSIPAEIIDEFARRKLLYVRNYGDIDLPWTEVFQTSDKEDVEAYCRNNDIEYEWIGESSLRTKQVNNAISTHPRTGENLWFNQAHMFHISNLPQNTRQSLVREFGLANVPRNVYFADGGNIEDEQLDIVRKAFNDNSFFFDWDTGDLLLLDNMLYAHGRQPYGGDRRILTGMAEPMELTRGMVEADITGASHGKQ